MMAEHSSAAVLKELPIQMGEPAAFERIFLLYHAPLRYYCEQLTGEDEASEDMVSQLFLNLWQRQVVFESTEHAQAYLYRSAKNTCLNFIRNEKRAAEKKEAMVPETEGTTDDYLNAFIKAEVWAELYRAIESLPTQCCKVITMSYLESMSNQEIADQIGLPNQVVKNYKLRGLRLLKSRLPEQLFTLLTTLFILK